MATEAEFSYALAQLMRYPATISGLRAELPMINNLAVQNKWRDDFDESLLDTPLLSHHLMFERPSLEALWVYVHKVAR